MDLGGLAQLRQSLFETALHLGNGLLRALVGFFQERGVQFRNARLKAFFLLVRLVQRRLNEAFTFRLCLLDQIAGSVLGRQQTFQGVVH